MKVVGVGSISWRERSGTEVGHLTPCVKHHSPHNSEGPPATPGLVTHDSYIPHIDENAASIINQPTDKTRSPHVDEARHGADEHEREPAQARRRDDGVGAALQVRWFLRRW